MKEKSKHCSDDASGAVLSFAKKNLSYNGGQKCWDLSSDITKTGDPSPPTSNKVEFGAKWVKLSAFFGHNIARGSGGDDGMNPKPNKNMSLGAESYGIIACKGFFTQYQVLLSSIVASNFKLTSETQRDFVSLFNKTIILLALVGYEMIIANSALRASLAIYHLIFNAPSSNNC